MKRRSGRTILLTGLAIDASGTGMFLPISLLYLVRVVGLPVATAGLVTAAATFGSLAVPALAGAIVDRVGARAVLIVAFAAQAVGMTAQVFVGDTVTAFATVLCTTLGQRAFWASVYPLLAEIAGDGAKEPTFALAGSLQAAGFAVGSAVGSLLIGVGDAGVYRLIVALNAASFLVGCLLVTFGVRIPRRVKQGPGTGVGYRVVLSDRRFLVVIVAYCALPLATNAATLAEPVYLVQQLGMPAWIPGMFGLLITVCTSTIRGRAVRRVRNWNRARTLRAAAAGVFLFFTGMASLVALPRGARLPVLIAVTIPYIAAQLVHHAAGNALFEAMAPPGAKGRYIAVSQYSWAITSVLASAMVSLFSVADMLPWLLSAGAAVGSVLVFGSLASRLPAEVAYRPDAVARQEPVAR